MVDHYRIIRALGAGGMAEVYLARDTMLGRKVALKIIHPKRSEKQESIQSFLFEAKATAKFNHPHIVTIYGVGLTDKGPYLALEYLEGQTLRARLDQERLSINESIRIAKAIAEALHVAHQQDILHRDLKPENVMLVKDGRLRVVDFGLSRLLGAQKQTECDQIGNNLQNINVLDGEEVSHEKEIKGTPAYMAPEQWQAKELSPKTDIWALGLILHEMLVGRHPYSRIGQVDQLSLFVTSDKKVPTPSVEGHVPVRVLELLSQCLEKDPRLRPNAEDLALDFELLLLGDKKEKLRKMSPFRGLVPFEEEHGSLYFGRDAEVDLFVERLRSEPILPVVGLSGAGKSSFVKAGVIPRLREKGPLIIVQLRPGRDPFFILASRLVQAWKRPSSSTGSIGPLGSVSEQTHTAEDSDHESIEPPEKLAQMFSDNPQMLGLWLHRLAERHRVHVVLFVDQLEELWVLRDADISNSSINSEQNSRKDVVARFMSAISAGADDPQLPVRVVVTIREEFISRLMTSGRVRAALSRIVVLRKPSQKTLVEILTRSVKAVGYQFEDYLLAQDMVTEVYNSESAFSLLQFAGQVLWQNRDQKRRILTRAAFENMGGVTGALVQHADGILTGLNANETNLARDLLLRLVTENKTKRIMSKNDLLAGLQIGAETVLARLVESRLVIISRKTSEASRGEKADEDGECELVHESLITSWDRLSKWIDESSEELRLLNQFEQAALLWDRRGRRVGELWGLQALKEVELLKDKDINSNPLMREFRRASERNIRQGRLVRTLIFGIMIAALGLAVWVGNNLLTGNKCTGAKNNIAQVWNKNTKKNVTKAFLNVGLSYAKETLLRVHRLLDTYTNEWANQYKQACEATHVKGEQSEAVLDLRMGCLRKRLKELKALVKVFTRADADVVNKAVQASISLVDINICANEESLRAPYLPPATAQARVKVNDIREKLTEVVALIDTGKFKEGLKLAKQLDQKAKAVAYQPVQAEVLYRLGALFERLGEYKVSESTLHRVVRIAGLSRDTMLAAKAMASLVWLVGRQPNRYEEAMYIARDAEVMLDLGGDNHAIRSQLLNNLCVVHRNNSDFEQALDACQRALAIREHALRPEHPEVANTLVSMAILFRLQRQYDQALEYYQRVLTIRKKAFGPQHPLVAGALNNMGFVFLEKEQYDKAVEYYSNALEIYEKGLGNKHPYVSITLFNMGALYDRKGDFEKANQSFQKSLAINEQIQGPEHPDLAYALQAIGALLFKQGRYAEALGPLKRLVDLCGEKVCDSKPYGLGLHHYARALIVTGGNKQKAMEMNQKAMDLFEKKPSVFKQELVEMKKWLKKYGSSR